MQIGFFLVPIFYQFTSIPVQYQTFYVANPVTTIMILYHDVLLYATFPPLALLGYAMIVAVPILDADTIIFNKMEPRFAKGM
jgi:ABC-type polysaccharide/polyol phosphate export permease